ncbi:hypothetical protein BDV98DRAFT_606557 [Pterulicium gracile]|uniref:BTB domain-containing protein n=1 Tax=Pterulicium gracile TaxID=1884261 RepID=A0A5C3Q9U4_9AGAR|nr:hypothetical protein BDV98DRAFT_606557 [Pterula gracilis]
MRPPRMKASSELPRPVLNLQMVNRAFNDESTADLILKSCNAQSFFVHKDILDAYSGTFADAGDCSSSGEPARQTSNQETVECTETGETLGYLLRFMYRNGVRPDLEVMSIVQLSALVDAAEKYDVFAIKDILWVYMRGWVKRDPIAVYQCAVVHGHKQLAVDSAFESVQHPSGATLDKRLSGFALEQWLTIRDIVWAVDSLTPETAGVSAILDHRVELCQSRKGHNCSCDLWRTFATELPIPLVEATFRQDRRQFIKAFDFTEAVEWGISNSLRSCGACQNMARTWLSELMAVKKAKLDEQFGEKK